MSWWATAVDATSTATVCANSAASVLLIALYAREPWMRNAFGRAFMTLAGALLLFSVLGVLVTFLGDDYLLRDELRACGRLAVLVSIVGVIVVLRRLKRRQDD